MNTYKSSVLFLVCFGFVLMRPFAQDGKIHVYGHLKNQISRETLVLGSVEVLKEDMLFIEQSMGKMGFYEFNLDLGSVYDVVFSSDGYLPKNIRFDTRNLTEEESKGGFDIMIDGTLIPKIEGFNLELLKEPMAICSFNRQADGFEFDGPFSIRRQEEIDAEIFRVKNALENGGK